MSNLGDFIIENSVLIKYVGPGGDVVIPESITSIGEKAFMNCSELKQITIPRGVTSIEEDAFAHCTNLTSITIPDSVTAIGRAAFWNCENLTCVNIPKGVAAIGPETFGRCLKLTNIVIPQGVNSIGERAFEGCEELASIEISSSVNQISFNAFTFCRSLSEINVNSSNPVYSSANGMLLTDKGQTLVKCPEGLKEAAIPKSVVAIGVEAFHFCSSLTELTIPEGVTFISKYAFSWCRILAHLTLPESLGWIEHHAFEGCSALTELIVPAGVKHIGEYAFDGCSSLKSVSILGDAITMGENVFIGCNNLENLTVKKWNQEGLPSQIKGLSLTSIHTQTPISELPAKYRVQALVGFSLENNIDLSSERATAYLNYAKKNAGKLCKEAFKYPALLRFLCDNKLIKAKDVDNYLREAEERGDTENKILLLNLQNELGFGAVSKAREKKETKQEKYAEALVKRTTEPQPGINGLTFVVTGKLQTWKSRKSLQEFLKMHGAKLDSSISIRSDYLVTNDQNSSSEKNKKAIEFGVQIISEKEFNDIIKARLQDIEHFIMPEGITEIPDNAFKNYWNLRDVKISKSVTSIGDEAFSGCKSLTSVTIPDSVTSIGSNAFSNCSSLTSVSIPEGVTRISFGAFTNCHKLTNVTVPSTVTMIDKFAFSNCYGLTSVTIPENVTQIGDCAFSNCDQLSTINIPKNVKSIGDDAFSWCKELEYVNISEGVKELSLGCFSNCKKLRKVRIPGSVKSIWDAFYGSPLVTIHAPKGSYTERFAKENSIPFVAE